MRNAKGVTLIEMLIVVVIIGILAAISVPAYIGHQKRAARTEAYTNLQNLRLLLEQYYSENSCYYMAGGPPVVCTNGNIAGVANIQAFLPRFQPGPSLEFNYSITTNSAGPGGGVASCFIATATGTGSRVLGDAFTIDCSNNRNF